MDWFRHYKIVCASHIDTNDKNGALSDLARIQEDVQANCIDKQKVREFLRFMPYKIKGNLWIAEVERIEKELGL